MIQTRFSPTLRWNQCSSRLVSVQAINRRQGLTAVVLLPLLATPPAWADDGLDMAAVADDLNARLAAPLVKKVQDDKKAERAQYTPEMARKRLEDAKAVLTELIKVAQSEPGSELRKSSERYYPGYARAVREVAQPAVFLAENSDKGLKASALSQRYGGNVAEGSGLKEGEVFVRKSPLDDLLFSLGRVITISGRTIRQEARNSPEAAQQALENLNAFLDVVG